LKDSLRWRDGKNTLQILVEKWRMSHHVLDIMLFHHRAANILSDGPMPVDKVHIHLVDFIVKSLLDMPEHRDIVVNWNMIDQAIRDVNPQKDTSKKEELTKQRVMLRMLVTSAKIALASGAPSAGGKANGKHPGRDENHINGICSSLLQILPSLLFNFKSDAVAMRDVTKLPPLISSAVLGLPARKSNFQDILKSLCQLYLDSTDEETLQNVAFTLSHWVEGDHTRVSEVKMQMKRLARGLVDRLMDLFRESDPECTAGKRKSPRKQRKSENGIDMFSASPEVETEIAIVSLMMRLKILLMECNASFLFENSFEEDEESELDGLFKTISEAMGQRLIERKNVVDNEEERTVTTASIWNEADPNLHEEVAKSLDFSLRVLLLTISHELADTLEGRSDFEASIVLDEEVNADLQKLLVVRHRDNLVKLLIMCFDHYIENDDACTDDHLAFSQKVQTSAAQVTSDLRSLFPYDVAEAIDPVRRAMSLQEAPDQSVLLGGFARWFQKQEASLESSEEVLAPLCRSVAVNMKEVSCMFAICRRESQDFSRLI
jgi:hypothetical protein